MYFKCQPQTSAPIHSISHWKANKFIKRCLKLLEIRDRQVVVVVVVVVIVVVVVVVLWKSISCPLAWPDLESE